VPERFEVAFSVNFVQAWQRTGTDPKTGHRYTKQATRDAERSIGIAYKGASIRKYGRVVTAPAGVPVAIKVEAYTPPPKKYPKYLPEWLRPRVPFVTKPDASNILKSVEDGLNGIAYIDDSQIIAAHSFKRDRNGVGADRTVVTVQFEIEQ
jgi:Holliday junction resolvase RusA-like endonuclease